MANSISMLWILTVLIMQLLFLIGTDQFTHGDEAENISIVDGNMRSAIQLNCAHFSLYRKFRFWKSSKRTGSIFLETGNGYESMMHLIAM